MFLSPFLRTMRSSAVARIPTLNRTFGSASATKLTAYSRFPEMHHRRVLVSRSTTARRSFQTTTEESPYASKHRQEEKPGSVAFADCEYDVIVDLFTTFAKTDSDGMKYLDLDGVRELLKSVGERPDEVTLRKLFKAADYDGNGVVELHEFLMCADTILGDAPARIVLVVGGPGSGKGVLCKRLEQECNVVHLSSGDLLRSEVERDTLLGREVKCIMERGELVSSAVIVTLIRRRMRHHPGKRVLLDGFPRSLENAHDLVELCGKPEIALHLDCDDTILMERIIGRGRKGKEDGAVRTDDNFDTALRRLRTYHKYHNSTMDWLKEHNVPVVNLDCSGSPETVWNKLLSIGRLMRPAARVNLNEDQGVLGDLPSAASAGGL